MLQLGSIGIGGFAGVIARYLVDGWVSDRTAGQFPSRTLAVPMRVDVQAYRGTPPVDAAGAGGARGDTPDPEG